MGSKSMLLLTWFFSDVISCLFWRCRQVISQFATISQSTGESSFPEPAATFVRALSVTSFEFLGIVPLGCVARGMTTHRRHLVAAPCCFHAFTLGSVARGMTFYDKIVVKVSTPVILVVLLRCYPLYNSMRGRPNAEDTVKVKGLALLLLELALPSVATALVKVMYTVR